MSLLLQVGVGALLEVLLEECLELLAVALQHHQLLKVVGSQGGPLGAEDVAGGAEQPLSGSGTGQGANRASLPWPLPRTRPQVHRGKETLPPHLTSPPRCLTRDTGLRD